MTERVLEEMPIFMQRLVAERGGSITGGALHVGSVAPEAVLDWLRRHAPEYLLGG